MKIIFRLDEILKERGMSIRQFAIMAGVHYRTALNIYHNRTEGISLNSLALVCNVLAIKPGELFKTIKTGKK